MLFAAGSAFRTVRRFERDCPQTGRVTSPIRGGTSDHRQMSSQELERDLSCSQKYGLSPPSSASLAQPSSSVPTCNGSGLRLCLRTKFVPGFLDCIYHLWPGRIMPGEHWVLSRSRDFHNGRRNRLPLRAPKGSSGKPYHFRVNKITAAADWAGESPAPPCLPIGTVIPLTAPQRRFVQMKFPTVTMPTRSSAGREQGPQGSGVFGITCGNFVLTGSPARGIFNSVVN